MKFGGHTLSWIAAHQDNPEEAPRPCRSLVDANNSADEMAKLQASLEPLAALKVPYGSTEYFFIHQTKMITEDERKVSLKFLAEKTFDTC